jgi:hypothetical protein
MERRRRDGNHTPQKNNSIEDLVRNEEMDMQFLTPNKTMINFTKEPCDAYKTNPSKRKSWEKSQRNSWRRY